jgi:hypothetical protein
MWVSEEQTASQAESAHPYSGMLLRAFEKMRGERSAPQREDLDLKQIRKLVPSLFIAEHCASSGDFRWRLAGTAVCVLMGHEVTGSGVAEGWDKIEGNTIRRFLAGVCGTHKPGLLRMRFMTDRGQWIVAEMTAVPLMAADGLSTHVLGGLFTFPDPGLKHFDEVTGRELVQASASSGERPAGLATENRRFRVITGGRSAG